MWSFYEMFLTCFLGHSSDFQMKPFRGKFKCWLARPLQIFAIMYLSPPKNLPNSSLMCSLYEMFFIMLFRTFLWLSNEIVQGKFQILTSKATANFWYHLLWHHLKIYPTPHSSVLWTRRFLTAFLGHFSDFQMKSFWGNFKCWQVRPPRIFAIIDFGTAYKSTRLLTHWPRHY